MIAALLRLHFGRWVPALFLSTTVNHGSVIATRTADGNQQRSGPMCLRQHYLTSPRWHFTYPRAVSKLCRHCQAWVFSFCDRSALCDDDEPRLLNYEPLRSSPQRGLIWSKRRKMERLGGRCAITFPTNTQQTNIIAEPVGGKQ